MSGTDHHPGFRAVRFNADWITRPLFALLLAAIALSVLAFDPYFFAGLVSLVALLGAREWQRMVGGGGRWFWIFNGAVVAAAVFLLLPTHNIVYALAVLALGAAVLAVKGDPGRRFWQAGGIAYLGFPALALTALRAFAVHGFNIIVGLFVIVWATDTGALIFGNLVGGPRLAPRLSPSKTWAGTLGGSFCAALAFAGYMVLLGQPVLLPALCAFFFSFTAHGGDLFESFVKRRFGIKDSGTMIPGHGGVLDRMDSTFGASCALALLVFAAHLSPLPGAHP